jgi:hypothetical protein
VKPFRKHGRPYAIFRHPCGYVGIREGDGNAWCVLCNPPKFVSDESREKWLAHIRWCYPDYSLPEFDCTPKPRAEKLLF